MKMNKIDREHYELVTERLKNGKISGEILARYNFASKFVRNAKVLDLGCGIGYGSYLMAREKAQYVVGLDRKEAAIRIATQHFMLPNLKYIVMNCLSPSLRSEKFNVVVAFELIEHIENDYLLLQNIFNFLDKTGCLILSTPNKEVTLPGRRRPPNLFHVREYLPEKLFDLLGEFFPRVEMYGVFLTGQDAIVRQKALEKSWKFRFFSFIGSFRLMRKIARIIPLQVRKVVQKDLFFNPYTADDYEIRSPPNGSGTLIAVCWKQEK